MAELSGGQRAAARAFKAARGRKGLTQATAARAAGVDRMVVVRFEGGRTWPDARTQARLEPVVAMPAGTLEDIAARYETDAELIDEQTDLTERLIENQQRQQARRARLTGRQSDALLERQLWVRELHSRRVALLRLAVAEGRTEDALAITDELDALMSEDGEPKT